MRKIIFLLTIVFFSSDSYGQAGFNDNKDGNVYNIEYRIFSADVLGRFRSYVGKDSILKNRALKRYLDKEPSALMLRILRTKGQASEIKSIFIYTVIGSKSYLNYPGHLLTLQYNEKEIQFLTNFLLTN